LGIGITTTSLKPQVWAVASKWTRWRQLALGIICMVMIANLQYGWTLFIDPIVSNEYALSYGKKKLYALTLGLLSMQNAEASVADVAESIREINRNERAYFAVYRLARRRMSNFYLELNTPEGRETFRREIKGEIAHDVDLEDLQDVITESLLEDVITKIRLEAFYINQLLPRIIEEHDVKVRNDFLSNSGLDRFQIEELESEYFELRAFPPQLLEVLQRPT
jgi:uncharacterized protein (TIGR04442 family)